MWVGVLGPVEVRDESGARVVLAAPRQRALLAMLALEAGRIVGHERLVDGLYPEPPAGAVNAVQSQVSRLRKAVPGLVVEHHPAGYRLVASPSEVDSLLCVELLDAGRGAEAFGLWRGTALADVDAPFVAGARSRLREVLIKCALSGGTEKDLHDLLEQDPLREDVRAGLMLALHRDGRQAQALEVFARGRELLADELGVDPSPVLAAAHQEVLRAAAPHRGVPAQLTSFVGRDEDLRRVGKWLRDNRLVTLIGPGGTGKTRLAVEVAHLQSGEVAFVDLSATTDVARALLDGVGVREAGLLTAGPVSVEDRLRAALATRAALLVVDNCEHVIDEAARVLGGILAACPDVRVLATSREPLGLTGETLSPVTALDDEAATRLFLDRAQAVRPGFTAPPDVVAEVCRRLDGIALAIELAAARVRSLPIGEIAARLTVRIDGRFGLLSKGSRTAAPRHRTLHAVVEWSWDLLTGAERDLAARFTVFSGGASLAAVAGVTGSTVFESTVSDSTVFDSVGDTLASLVDKSLVEIAGDRYRMLDTVRAFCAAHAPDLRERHARWFLARAVQAEPHLRAHEQLSWLRELGADHDNLTAAVAWATGHDVELALELVAALATYYWCRGLRTEAARQAEAVLRACGETPPAGREQEYALCLLIAWPVAAGDQSARQRQADALLGELAGPPRYPILTMMWGMALGAPETQSQTWLRRHRLVGSDPWSKALSLVGDGLMAWQQGDPGQAAQLLREGAEAFGRVGDRWGVALAVNQLAELALAAGDVDTALVHIDRACRLLEELGATEDTAEVIVNRARARLHQGDSDGARADYAEALRAARRAGAPLVEANCHLGLSVLARLDGDLRAAWRECERAWELCPGGWYGPDETRCHIAVERGRVAKASGDLGQARQHFDEALRRAAGQRNAVTEAAVRAELAALSVP
ncbi:BTAD domain-containing putative transcriptional regulator [Lentzea aerocolonigenes]|uniref:BTAD domain-containing putative transcriptional regulator n=1 Tax=Lentzea aerocolonigenes TaxID=68170 RepID=UPI000750BF3A|nr:BTAD domain-containing putative transcriptional regulator [Lentzea aerocolonigenes]MCP2244456.1 putative ATPase [Lentzea aerocolonigenes]